MCVWQGCDIEPQEKSLVSHSKQVQGKSNYVLQRTWIEGSSNHVTPKCFLLLCRGWAAIEATESKPTNRNIHIARTLRPRQTQQWKSEALTLCGSLEKWQKKYASGVRTGCLKKIFFTTREPHGVRASNFHRCVCLGLRVLAICIL